MNTNIVSLPATLELNIDLTDEQFFQLCQNNRDLRFERTGTGELIIMPPTGSETGLGSLHHIACNWCRSVTPNLVNIFWALLN
jgi:hypothetical protein